VTPTRSHCLQGQLTRPLAFSPGAELGDKKSVTVVEALQTAYDESIKAPDPAKLARCRAWLLSHIRGSHKRAEATRTATRTALLDSIQANETLSVEKKRALRTWVTTLLDSPEPTLPPHTTHTAPLAEPLMAALVASVSLDPSAPSAATPAALIPQTHATATAAAGKLLFVQCRSVSASEGVCI
jgi:hypothetical protein